MTERNSIEPRGYLTVAWRMETNPADKLFSLQSVTSDLLKSVPNQFETELEVSVTCEVLGKVKHCKTRLYVQVDSSNHRIDHIAG